MSNFFSKIFGSVLSIGDLDNIKSEDELQLIFLELDIKLKEYSASISSNNIGVEFPNDFIEYKINDYSFEDFLLRLVEDDFGKWQYYMGELVKIIGQYVEYNNTLSMIALTKEVIESSPRLYLYVLNDFIRWTDLEDFTHTHCWRHTLTLNSISIANISNDLDDFIDVCIKNFEFIEFHKDIKNTLKTIQKGVYGDYIQTLLHSLNVLNQAYHLISTDANQNQEDLGIIIALSEELGKRLDCSRQGSNKVKSDFNYPKVTELTGKEIINCEYHLKIDNYDNGQPIPRGKGNNIRIYFGLKSYEQLPRKRLIIAHIGKHL